MPELRPRRVLMTTDTVGGVWTFAMELASGLSREGVDVLLATLGAELTEEQKTAANAIPRLRLFPSRYKLEWMDDPWTDVEQSGAWLVELERELKPDVVHLNTLVHGSLPFIAPVLLTAHSCVLSWWAAVKGTPVPPEWNRYREAVGRSLRSVAMLITPSNALFRMLRESYGTDLPACRVVPNGRTRAPFHTGTKEHFVFTAGRLWDEAKNVAAVAGVAPKLPWPTYVAGEQRHPGGASIDLPDVRLLGQLSQDSLAEWYGCASIYALPARYEPFGLSVVEAALSGCALVLGDIESLREIWDDSAVYVSPDDTDQLASALRALMANQPMREELARRSLARALTYTPERMAGSYLEAYESLIEPTRVACAS